MTYAHQPVPPARKKSRTVPIVIAALAVLAIGAGAAIILSALNERGAVQGAVQLVAGKDSGVEACEMIRDAQQNDDGQADPWTAEEYQAFRGMFDDSKHEAIRRNGVQLADIGWQIQQLPEDAGLEALPLLGSFMDAYAGLTGACMEQGVELPPIEFETSAETGR